VCPVLTLLLQGTAQKDAPPLSSPLKVNKSNALGKRIDIIYGYLSKKAVLPKLINGNVLRRF